MTQKEFAWLMANHCTCHCKHCVIVDGEGLTCLCVDRGAQTPEGCPIFFASKEAEYIRANKETN